MKWNTCPWSGDAFRHPRAASDSPPSLGSRGRTFASTGTVRLQNRRRPGRRRHRAGSQTPGTASGLQAAAAGSKEHLLQQSRSGSPHHVRDTVCALKKSKWPYENEHKWTYPSAAPSRRAHPALPTARLLVWSVHMQMSSPQPCGKRTRPCGALAARQLLLGTRTSPNQ
jgi:hypothetical protein